MNKILIDAKNITKIYNENTDHALEALSDVSLIVYEGDFLCIMGPSGSGKSTLLNNISTIDEPSKGILKIDGKEIKLMSEREIGKFRYEKLGFIFQNYNLIESLTIYENIATPLSLQKKSINNIETLVKEYTDKLMISDLLHKFPNECSGGQKQRAAICRSLVTNPKIIIADEPTGNLDSKNSHDLLSMLKTMNNENNLAIVMVSHDAQIASYSSKLLFIKDGKIAAQLERGNKTQKEYFYEIIQLTSSETQDLFDN
ncbi:ABC transporter ATP-binding protein [Tannockella kyphosi]|uniref:ABC transporter ATP-binding protein n=1 Tax=Tannockella kyphosi TaxID=2899121 RepID=UPI002012B933|nr:ABC transporter ATP-binding protein [Tannockella kyphosi]